MVPLARDGQRIEVKHSEVPFSLWPVARTTRRARLQSQLFVADPWALIAEATEKKCPKATRDAAHAFRRQSEDYFKAATSDVVVAAKPVLLYYSFLNLAKSFALTKGVSHLLGRAGHGLSESVVKRPIAGAVITLHSSKAGKPQVFDEFLKAVRGKGLRKRNQVTFGNLLVQIVSGHRLWCYATGRSDRFFALKRAVFLHDSVAREMWVRFSVAKNDLARSNVSHRQFMKAAGLGPSWREVRIPNDSGVLDEEVHFEQVSRILYTHRPGDKLRELAASTKSLLWQTVNSSPPYRRYYFFMCPDEAHADLLPQLLSLYAAMFFLGSITRYYPEHFERMLESSYGPVVEAILNESPAQFLYLLASELLEQDVSKPTII